MELEKKVDFRDEFFWLRRWKPIFRKVIMENNTADFENASQENTNKKVGMRVVVVEGMELGH